MKPHRDNALQLIVSSGKADKHTGPAKAFGCIVLALLLYLGIGGQIISLFELPVLGVVPAVLGVIIITCAFVFCPTLKSRLMGIALLIICVVILWVVAAQFAQAGLSLTMNRISEVSDIQHLRINAQYEVSVPPEIYDACGTLFLMPFAVFLALASIFVVEHAYSLAGVAALVVLAVFSAFEAVNHSGIWSALLCIGTALLVCRALSSNVKAADSSAILLPAAGVLFAACAIGVIVLTLLPGDAFGKLSYLLERNQRNVLSAVDSFRYQSGTHSVFPQGEFSEISEPDINFETTLSVTMSQPDSIYLRGYIGEVYTDFGWEPISKRVLHEYTALFYQLHKSGFYPQTQLAQLARILDDSLTDEDIITLTVKNSAAHRGSIYTPYELFSADESLLPTDRLIESGLYNRGVFGTREYTLSILPNQVKRYDALSEMLAARQQNPSEELEQYLAQEAKYRSFVYEQYAKISTEDSRLLTAYIGDPGITGQTHVSYKDAKNNVLAILSVHLDNSYNNAAFDGDGSFLRYIMKKNQSASSVGYASVAVMMLRHYGIPARYVEGYIIIPDEAESMEADTAYNLTDYNEHAWVEYYHDGIGWIPFEVDPEYLGVMEGINDPPLSSQGGQGNQGGEDEDEQEEPPEDRDDKEADEGNGFMRRLWSWVRWPLLLLALAGAWLFYRKKYIEKRKRQCGQSDNNAAVGSMMAYVLALLDAVGVAAEPSKSPTHLIPKMAELWGEPWDEEFEAAVDVFLKSTFSRHVVSPSERAVVASFLERTIAQIAATQTKTRRFVIRYLKCLY